MGGKPGFQILRETNRLANFIRWIAKQRPDGRVALILNGDVFDTLAEDIYRMYIPTGDVFPRDGGFAPEAVGKMIQMMAAVGDIQEPLPDPAQYIDFTYLEPAQRACSG